jgi:predicted MFS family arabinose efflux permease
VTDLVGWRAVFWAYLPLAVALAGANGRAVPPDGETDRSVRLNLASSAAFTLAVMAFVIATTLLPGRGEAAAGAILLGLAIALTGLFIAVDRRSAAPLLPRALLRERPLRQGALGGLLNTLTTSSALTLVTLYLQNTRGRSPLVAGLMLLPFSLAAVAGSTVAPWVLARWRPQRVAAAGLALIALSDTALITAVGSSWALPVCNVAGGAGIGLASVATTGLGTSVPAAARGTASGIINTAAQLGTALGIAILLLVAAVTTGVPEPHRSLPAAAWALAAAISLTGATAFILWDRRTAPAGRTQSSCSTQPSHVSSPRNR